MRALIIGPAILLLVALAGVAGAESHSFMWWAHGFRGTSPEGRRVMNVQTSAYGASFDVERASITRLGRIERPASYAAAAAQANALIDPLPPAELRLTVSVDGNTYSCKRAARNVKDQMNYPVRLIDSGRWLSRFDMLGLEFEDEAGEKLDAEGRLEVAAWPERMHLTLELTPPLPNATLAIELKREDKVSREETAFQPSASAAPMRVHLVWPPEEVPASASNVQVRDCSPGETLLPARYDETIGAVVVTLPSRQWNVVEELDRLDRFPVVIKSDVIRGRACPVLFEFDGSFQGVTGLCPMLFSEGRPSGIPVQISKNWHRQPDRRMLYEGPWLHAAALIPENDQDWVGELLIAYARWGGVPAASHAQLCLIGYGGNQRWDQAAIGSFGESICYDPDVGLNRSVIDDVRPLMVRSMNDGQWEWTHNVGGGDFLVYYNTAGEKQYFSSTKTAYVSQGPNLTDVVYAGESADGKIAARIEVQTPRCDDVNRAYHRVRYDVRATTDFSRLAFYQLGADGYNDHQFTTIARGNNDGLVEEWTTERGGMRYLRKAMPCEGGAPWVALLGGIRSASVDKGAWADRAIVFRGWKARLGGQDVPVPWVASFGTDNGIPSANIELVPPPGITQLLPDDFVEADIELLILPQHAEYYYGPNEAFRSDLQENGGTWRSVQRLAKGNDLEIQLTKGMLARKLPVEIVVDGESQARFSINGGVGYVPVTLRGVKAPAHCTLEADGGGIDAPGEWQLTPGDGEADWACTFNVPMDGEPRSRELVFRTE